MYLLLILIVCMFPIPALASTYDVYTSSNVGSMSLTATAESVSWRTGTTPINVFGPTPIVYPTTLPFNETRIWTVTPTHTQFATLSGVILLDGVTTSYSLDGPRFVATFAQATIIPALIGGVDSHDWHGQLEAALLRNTLPQGDWNLHAATTMPEPSTLALVGPALVGLWWFRRT